jgi:hypothetical protein
MESFHKGRRSNSTEDGKPRKRKRGGLRLDQIGAEVLIQAYRDFSFPRASDKERLKELASLNVDDFPGRTIEERGSRMYLYGSHLQRLVGRVFQPRQQLYAYLHTAIFSRPELDGIDISDRQLDPSQLEQNVRDALRRYRLKQKERAMK